MVAASGMCFFPEPTMTTKVCCVVVGAHAVDVVRSFFEQIITGRLVETKTTKTIVVVSEML